MTDSPEEYLRECIETFVRESPTNRFQEIDGTAIFEEPLVGYADGDDPLFQEYKAIIGAFHVTPREAIQHILAEGPTATHNSLERVSVVCWILPIAEETRLSNRREGRGPSKRWAHTKFYGERFNDALRDHVVGLLREAGYLAIAPVRSALFKTYSKGIDCPPASTWSERHVQFVGGLGTFGLSDGFITAKGMAMRCGSVVTNLPLVPSPRPYQYHYANCPSLSGGVCGKCIERCPAGAITEHGHDKEKCTEYIGEVMSCLREAYRVDTYACGLCQTDVPCEAAIPR